MALDFTKVARPKVNDLILLLYDTISFQLIDITHCYSFPTWVNSKLFRVRGQFKEWRHL